MDKSNQKKELSIVYWRNFFVPVVITLLIFISMFVFITTKIGLPHAIINKLPIKSPNIMRGY